MEGFGIIGVTILFIVAFVLGILLLFLPVFVFQISNTTARSEELLKKAVKELEKISAHLTPPPPQE